MPHNFKDEISEENVIDQTLNFGPADFLRNKEMNLFFIANSGLKTYIFPDSDLLENDNVKEIIERESGSLFHTGRTFFQYFKLKHEILKDDVAMHLKQKEIVTLKFQKINYFLGLMTSKNKIETVFPQNKA